MLKIFVKTLTENTVIFKDDKIENNLESVEHILTAVEKITGEKAWEWTGNLGGATLDGKLVIELSMSGEDTEKIENLIKKKKKGKK